MSEEKLIAQMVKNDLIEKALAIKAMREARDATPIRVYSDGGLIQADAILPLKSY